jgi:hypothetical protein
MELYRQAAPVSTQAILLDSRRVRQKGHMAPPAQDVDGLSGAYACGECRSLPHSPSSSPSRGSRRTRVKTRGRMVPAIFQARVAPYSARGPCPHGKAQSYPGMVMVSPFPKKYGSGKGSVVRKPVQRNHLLSTPFSKRSVLGSVGCPSHSLPVALFPQVLVVFRPLSGPNVIPS